MIELLLGLLIVVVFILGTTMIALLRRIEETLQRIIKRWAALENLELFPEEDAEE